MSPLIVLSRAGFNVINCSSIFIKKPQCLRTVLKNSIDDCTDHRSSDSSFQFWNRILDILDILIGYRVLDIRIGYHRTNDGGQC